MKKKLKIIYEIAKKISLSALINDEIRLWYGKIRFEKYKKHLRIYKDSKSQSVKNVTSYNAEALKDLTTDFYMRRMKWLIFSSLAIETVSPTSKILVIGPRTENEILFLKALGYKNVQGIDLISYSPWVELGDMHSMPFTNSSFDIVLCGWTLPYSKNPRKAASEILRVTKKGGVIAIGLEHIPSKLLNKMKNLFWKNNATDLNPREIAYKRLNSCKDILAVFERKKIENVYFRHDAPLRKEEPEKIQKISGLASSQVMICFRRR